LAAAIVAFPIDSAGMDRGELKKKRRVELHIEHREITVFAGPGGLAGQQSPRAACSPQASPGASSEMLALSHACPVCGSFQLLPLAETVSSPGIDLRVLQQGMEDGSVHLHRSPDGAWWICTASLKQS
jgi:hypothetical protein